MNQKLELGLFFVFILFGCCSKSIKKDLNGKIAYPFYQTENLEFKCRIIDHEKSYELILPSNKELTYELLSWLPNRDLLLFTRFNPINSKDSFADLVLIDTIGKTREVIYKKLSNIVYSAYSSPTQEMYAYVGINYTDSAEKISLNIIDPKNGNIKNCLVLDYPLFISLKEVPWSLDGKKIFYSITKREGDEKIKESFKEGIYLYDLNTNKNSLYVEGGYNVICSPGEKQIAYLRDGNVWIHDLDKQLHVCLYKTKFYDRIGGIKYSPNGEFVLIRKGRFQFFRTFRKPVNILIRTKTGEEYGVNTNLPMSDFLWK